MAWIELHQTMNKHRKTLRLASILNISRREAVGLLCDLWLWAVDNADQDGNLNGLTADDIGMALDMSKKESTKTVKALEEAGFLVLKDNQFSLHDWYDYCGKLNEKRETDRRRKAETRKKSERIPKDVQRTSSGNPLVTVPNLTVPNLYNNSSNNNARAQEDLTEQKTEDADILSVSPEEAAQHRQMIERIENKAKETGLPFFTADIDRALVLVDEYSLDWLIAAIERASEGKERTWRYVRGILRSWKEKGGIDNGKQHGGADTRVAGTLKPGKQRLANGTTADYI